MYVFCNCMFLYSPSVSDKGWYIILYYITLYYMLLSIFHWVRYKSSWYDAFGISFLNCRGYFLSKEVTGRYFLKLELKKICVKAKVHSLEPSEYRYWSKLRKQLERGSTVRTGTRLLPTMTQSCYRYVKPLSLKINFTWLWSEGALNRRRLTHCLTKAWRRAAYTGSCGFLCEYCTKVSTVSGVWDVA
jgi:hypothetical protein